MGQQLAEGVRVAIAKGTSDDYTLTADDLNAFNSDTGYYKYALDNAVNFSSGELHVHGLCGTANCAESENHKKCAVDCGQRTRRGSAQHQGWK